MNAERWRSTAIAARLSSLPSAVVRRAVVACRFDSARSLESGSRIANDASRCHHSARHAPQITHAAETSGRPHHNAHCTAPRDARRPSRPHHGAGGAVVAKLGAGRGLGRSRRGRRARGRGRAAAAVRRGVGGARRPRLIQRGAALRPVEARRRGTGHKRRREKQCHLRRVRRRVEINQ